MSPSHRTLTIAVVAALFALGARAVEPPEPAQAKSETVRHALARQGHEGLGPVFSAAADRAAALRALVPDQAADGAQVAITMSRPVAYRMFHLDGGRKTVVDLYDTVNLVSGDCTVGAAAPLVTAVRSSLFALEPQFISRVVVETAAPCSARMETDSAGLRLVVFPKQQETELSALTRRLDDAAQRILRGRGALEELMARHVDQREGGHAKAVAALDELNRKIYEAKTERLAAELVALRAEPAATAVPASTIADADMVAFEAEIQALHAKETADAETVLREALSTAAGWLETLAQHRAELVDLVASHALQSGEGTNQLAGTQAACARIEAEQGAAFERFERALKAALSKNYDGQWAKLAAQITAHPTKPARVEPVPTRAPRTASATTAAVTHEPQPRGRSAQEPETAEPQPNRAAEPAPVVQTEAPTPFNALPAPSLDDRIAQLNVALASVSDEAFVATEPPVVPLAALRSGGSAPAAPVRMAQADVPEVEAEDVSVDPDVAESMRQALERLGEGATPAPDSAPAEEAVPSVEEPARVEAPIQAPGEGNRVRPNIGPGALSQLVTFEARSMDLSQVVAILAQKAGINVVGGTELTGTVTVSFRDVPLRQAIETVLRLNGLGMVEEEGIFRIVPYAEAVEARRVSQTVFLENAKAIDVKGTLDSIVQGTLEATTTTIAANDSANVIIVSGPVNRVEDLVRLARELDMADQQLPTVTEVIKLNHAKPETIAPVIEGILTPEIGMVLPESRSRQLVVTDYPVVVEQVRKLVTGVDLPVKQVMIEAMVVDAVMRDATQTGVDWTLDLLRRSNTRGELVGNLENLSFDSSLGAGSIGTDALNAGILSFGTLSSEISFRAAIAAEVASRNAEILARPHVATVENVPATINISQEFPYQELTQGLTGPPIASTEFKDIGVTLEVTPQVTFENEIETQIDIKQSAVSGLTEDGIPIEDKRQASTTLRLKNGRTAFIGGLRNISNRTEMSKIPVLGDIPVMNFMFRNTDREKIHTELLLFITCNVIEDDMPELTPMEQTEYGKLGATPDVPETQGPMFQGIVRPNEMRQPVWKYRRTK